jgi:shikimate kinase
MGQVIQDIFNHVNDKFGLQARMRVSMKSGIPTGKAMEIEDSPELVAKLKEAVKEVTGEDSP